MGVIKAVDCDDLVRRYRSGASVNQVASELGVSRTLIVRRLLERGITPRGRSESERLKWAAMPPAARSAQVAAAHRTRRGQRDSASVRSLRASTREARGLHTSPSERELSRMLAERGVSVVAQQAIGPYNCDLGAAPVAVEIFGGEWHWSGRHLLRTPRRFRYIMKAGWHVLVVHVTPSRFPLTAATADYVAAYVKKARRDPTVRREYRVIRATGEVEASGSVDDDKIAIIPALTLGRDRTTGRYKSVPR